MNIVVTLLIIKIQMQIMCQNDADKIHAYTLGGKFLNCRLLALILSRMDGVTS